MKQIYIEDLQEEHEYDRDLGFVYDAEIPEETFIRISYRGILMLSLPVYGNDYMDLHAVCNAIITAYREGEIYGRYAECMCI